MITLEKEVCLFVLIGIIALVLIAVFATREVMFTSQCERLGGVYSDQKCFKKELFINID